MRDKPSGAALAALACLVTEPAELAARCRAIAAREAEAGEGAFGTARAALGARYGQGDDRFLLGSLVLAIRAGALDDGSPERAALAGLLREITLQKLRESNPETLAAGGASVSTP